MKYLHDTTDALSISVNTFIISKQREVLRRTIPLKCNHLKVDYRMSMLRNLWICSNPILSTDFLVLWKFYRDIVVLFIAHHNPVIGQYHC